MSWTERKIRPVMGVKEAKFTLDELLAHHNLVCTKVNDTDNEEKMIVFYDSKEDYCVSVHIYERIHLNETVREMREILETGEG